MVNSENFLVKWKPRHEKGMFRYVLPRTLLMAIVSFGSALYFSQRHDSMHNLNYVLGYNIYFLVFFFMLTVFEWFRSEHKYKQLLADKEKNSKSIPDL